LYTIEAAIQPGSGQGKAKKHIFAGDSSIATIDDGKIIYHHTDHLSGSSVETNKDGYAVEVLDYYPFGSVRLDNKYTTYENDKKFTGYELDASGLYYAGQRYYDSEVGRFMSVDPLSIVMGTREAEQITEMKLPQLLADPQNLNSYAYVKNNPLRYTDPDGQFYGDIGRQMAADQRKVGDFFNASADYAQAQGGIVGHSAAFVNHTIGGMINNAADVFDPDTKGSTRGLAIGFMALDVGTGGRSSVANKGIKEGGSVLWSAFTQAGLLKKEVIENSKTIFSGAEGTLRAAKRLSEQYGGGAKNWVKNVTKEIFVSPTGIRYQPHYYKNVANNKIVEVKSVLIDFFKK